jgi:hypothetical protein
LPAQWGWVQNPSARHSSDAAIAKDSGGPPVLFAVDNILGNQTMYSDTLSKIRPVGMFTYDQRSQDRWFEPTARC